MQNDFRVLLYYKYQAIEDAEQFAKDHLAFCKSIGLKGRVLVSDEGINGTVSGPIEVTNQYEAYVHSLPGFEDLWFKVDEVSDYAHKKMFVRYRPEIVSLKLEDDVNPLETTGDYLTPSQFRDAILDENTVVIDARNDYEYDLGHFRGAVRPDIRNFRDLPQWIRDNKEQFMDKKIVTYCTGGVRCEKFSGWLLKEGFESVGQLHGGIDTYGKDPEVQGDLWEGKMYVFDERIAVDINHIDPSVIGRDWYTGEATDRYVNCANPECNRQFFLLEANENRYLRSCSVGCMEHPRNRYVIENNLSHDEWQERIDNVKAQLQK